MFLVLYLYQQNEATMNVSINITNEEIYSKKVIDIDTDGMTCNDYPRWSCTGHLSIELEGGNGWQTISGEFGRNDYKEDYGFVFDMAE